MELEPISFKSNFCFFLYYIIPIWNWSKLKPVAWSSMKKPLHYSYMELELITPLFTFPITEKITLFLYGIGANLEKLNISNQRLLHYSYMELEL